MQLSDIEQTMKAATENLKQNFGASEAPYGYTSADVETTATEIVEENQTTPPVEKRTGKKKQTPVSPGSERRESSNPTMLKFSRLINSQTYGIAAVLFFVSCLVERSSTLGSKYYNTAAPIAYLIMVSTASLLMLGLVLSGRSRVMEYLFRFLFLFPLCWLGAKFFLSIISA